MENDKTAQLERLAALRASGALTEDEFQAQKASVLGVGPQNTKKTGAVAQSALGCVGLIVILVIIAAIFGGTKGTNSKAPVSAAIAAPMAVTALALSRAYQANEARAQSQYGNRPLLVSGVVDGIDLDVVDNPVVHLRTDNVLMPAQVDLADSSKSKARDLDKGQTVTLLCQGVSEVMSIPMLSDCELK